MDEPTALPSSIRFDVFELRLDRRELQGPNGIAGLEPRMLDLLVYLIQNRNRVVPTEEILEKVWKTIYISDSALPHTISKLRKELGDTAAEARLIKTVSRVGYRFVADITQEFAAQVIEPRVPALRLALLPFENATGNPDLDWIELGLLTLVSRSIASTGSASVVRIEDTILALSTCAADATTADKAGALGVVLGVRRVAHVSIELGPAENFRLRWETWLPDGRGPAGEIVGDALIGLAQDFAASLQQAILPEPERHGTSVLETEDPFVNEAYARAMQAYEKEHYLAARDLMDVCMHADPRPLQLDIDYLRIVLLTAPSKALQRGQELLERVTSRTQMVERAAILTELADCAHKMRDHVAAEHYIVEAETLASEAGADDLLEKILAIHGRIAYYSGETNFARHACNERLRIAHERGNRAFAANALTDLGGLEITHGDWNVGKAQLQEAATILRELGLVDASAVPLTNLAWGFALRGQPRAALPLIEEAVTISMTSGNRWGAMNKLVVLYRCYCDLGRTADAMTTIATMRDVIAANSDADLFLGRPDVADALVRFNHAADGVQLAGTALADARLQGAAHGVFGHYLLTLMMGGAFDVAQSLIEQNAALYDTTAATQESFNFQRAMAQMHYAQGQADRARDGLQNYLALRGAEVSTNISADLLWILLDLDDLDGAQDVAASIADELAQTFQGRLACARLRYASGNAVGALAIQAELVDAAAGRTSQPQCVMLATFYQKAVDEDRALPFPTLPLLPTGW